MVAAGVLETFYDGKIEMVSQPTTSAGNGVEGITRVGTQKVVIVCL